MSSESPKISVPVLKNPLLFESKLNSLPFMDSSVKLLKPYYNTSNISRYFFSPLSEYKIIYTTSDFKNTKLMDKYPTLKKHLDDFVDVITSDNRPYGLHRARKKEFFEEPKIFSLRKCIVPTFSYVDIPAYVTAEWYVIKTNRVDMRYLTSLLNSSLIKYWLLKMGKIQGNIYQVDKEPLINIPIAIPDKLMEMKIIELFNIISERRKTDKNSDIEEFEKEIDDLIFTLYEINDMEKKIVYDEIIRWENK